MVSHPEGLTVKEIIASWKDELLTSAVAAKVNDEVVDLSFSVKEDSSVEVVDINSKEGLSILRHSISHVMAQAVQDIFEGVKVSIGPAIPDGFYYDFDYTESFTPEDLGRIEERMK